MDQNSIQKHYATPGSVKREGFTTSLGVIAATLGSAVGLGNIWKFPYMTGENGGAAFILVYLICVTLVSLPVMLSEFIIGRRANANAVTAFKKLEPQKPWFITGIFGVTAAFMIMFFYTAVAGWVYSYIFKSAGGALSSLSAEETGAVFQQFTSGVFGPLFWQWIVLALTGMIILLGVKNGIERMTKTLLPILFVLLVICDIRALTLPGAAEGIAFLFSPDFSKITGATILAALGLAFFKLSVGMGTMITYGSYTGKNENLPRTATKVMLSDTLVSILAGMAIFPAVFAFGFKPDAGPSLLFITIPMVFNSMPFGQVFLVLFFTLSSIAATGAMISLVEVPVAYFTEEWKWSRKKSTIVTILVMALFGSTAALSSSVLAEFQLFHKNMFDLFDFVSSNILLPVGGILICLFVGWKLGGEQVFDEASNGGTLKNQSLLKVFLLTVRYFAPAAILLVLLNGLNIIRL